MGWNDQMEPTRAEKAIKMSKPKTHQELEISFAEYGALIAVRTMLAQGLLPHADAVREGEHLFNMSTPMMQARCGTLACIGGTMAIILGKKPNSYVHRDFPRSLRKLFWPDAWTKRYGYIQPYQAVQAIDNFLLTGEPHWPSVLGKAPNACE